MTVLSHHSNLKLPCPRMFGQDSACITVLGSQNAALLVLLATDLELCFMMVSLSPGGVLTAIGSHQCTSEWNLKMEKQCMGATSPQCTT